MQVAEKVVVSLAHTQQASELDAGSSGSRSQGWRAVSGHDDDDETDRSLCGAGPGKQGP